MAIVRVSVMVQNNVSCQLLVAGCNGNDYCDGCCNSHYNHQILRASG
jgi:hypothetical protein